MHQGNSPPVLVNQCLLHSPLGREPFLGHLRGNPIRNVTDHCPPRDRAGWPCTAACRSSSWSVNRDPAQLATATEPHQRAIAARLVVSTRNQCVWSLMTLSLLILVGERVRA